MQYLDKTEASETSNEGVPVASNDDVKAAGSEAGSKPDLSPWINDLTDDQIRASVAVLG